EKHGLPLPNNYQELDLDQLIRIARRDRNRLFEEISRLDARLSHSPLMAEADLLRHELQEIRHSGMLRHGAQMPEIVSLDSELTPLQRLWREYASDFPKLPSEVIRERESAEYRQYIAAVEGHVERLMRYERYDKEMEFLLKVIERKDIGLTPADRQKILDEIQDLQRHFHRS